MCDLDPAEREFKSGQEKPILQFVESLWWRRSSTSERRSSGRGLGTRRYSLTLKYFSVSSNIFLFHQIFFVGGQGEGDGRGEGEGQPQVLPPHGGGAAARGPQEGKREAQVETKGNQQSPSHPHS